MAWDSSFGELNAERLPDDKYWSLFNSVFSSSSRNTTSYKFGLIKSILDNIFNAELITYNDEEVMYISYNDIYEKFTRSYWNLVLKYNLRQMTNKTLGKNGAAYSSVERILYDYNNKNALMQFIEFDSLNVKDKTYLIKEVTKNCKRNVLGALYGDLEGYIYGFSKSGTGIYISIAASHFMMKYKFDLEELNYYSWARFLEKVNIEELTNGLLGKIEVSSDSRKDLSPYLTLLKNELQNETCFYCGKKLNKNADCKMKMQ